VFPIVETIYLKMADQACSISEAPTKPTPM
jgi:hypothetical protein